MISKKSRYLAIAFSIVIPVVILFTVRFDIETRIFPSTVQLPDGGQYYGELKDNLFTGEGKIIWTNGASYHGQFKQGLFHGYGKRVNATGNIYDGQFVNGVFTGQGKVTTVDGSIYKGQVENYQFNGYGRWEFGEGSHYVGQFKNGRYHGYGSLVITDGDSYNGNFKNGYYQGEGEIYYAKGDSYKGTFKKNKWQGKGIYTSADKRIYEGDFVADKLMGQGIYTEPEGNRYKGGFKDWMYDGKGRYHSEKGDFYEGVFIAGSLTGEGVFKGKDGRSYQGEFKDWSFHGQGILLESNGDRYQGLFSYGNYNGKGSLTYAAPKNGKTGLTGKWRYGRYIGDGTQPDLNETNTEKALYVQNQLLDETFNKILTTDRNKINLYFVGIGGDGKQDVFYKEVSYIRNLFDTSFDTRGRSAILVNNAETVNTVPLATVTSIKKILNDVAAKMDAKKDILFLYLTSHGSKKHKLSIAQRGLALPDLSAKQLAKMLKDLPIRWKIVMISACYSGGFIPFLKDDYSLIMTAAAHNRTSFGCSDKADMTYFGRAYFKEALTTSVSFETAFVKAKELVHEWEEKEIAKDKKNKHSDPQIYKPKRMSNYLKKWFKQQQQNEVAKPQESKVVGNLGLDVNHKLVIM
ncbi:MAG: caspase family protein [Methylococcales bacterium]|nr:caspase family protein [Methylococcales bacterium]